MSRVDELKKKYPGIPRDVIVKWDVHKHGMRDTEDLNRVSDWIRNANTYQTYDHDITLNELMGKRPERLKPGHMLRPREFRLRSGIGAPINLDSKSPYEIRDQATGQFDLYQGEEKVEHLFFPCSRRPMEPELVTSKGTPVHSLVTAYRRCFGIVPVRYCEYFALGDQCRFCNFNRTQADARSIGLNRPITIELEETVEAYKLIGADFRYIEGRLEMGGFMNSEREEKIYLCFVEKIANAFPSYKPNIALVTEAMSRRQLQRLKDVGLDGILVQMEVMDPQLFPEVCPGKAKHLAYEGWLEASLEAVEVLGVGNVACTLVGGVTLVPPNGHRTWQEARDYHIEANQWLIENGIFPAFTYARLPPGSAYGEDPANRDKLPPTEYYLEVAQAHHEAMVKHALYDRMNKFNFCGMTCTAGPVYVGELGMLTLAGDVGKWMADCVPDDANWVAKFIASMESPVRIQ